ALGRTDRYGRGRPHNCGQGVRPAAQEPGLRLVQGHGDTLGTGPPTTAAPPMWLLVQVEDAALDTYDLVYDQVVTTASRVRQQELAAIQDAFLCCGKRSPFSLLGRSDAGLCQGEEAARQDCLQGIRGHLRPYQSVLSTLSGIGLALTGCALLLSAFLWFAVRSGRSLDRKGKYILAARAHGCQPQEPSFFRHSQDGPATRAPSGADAAGDSEALGGSRTTDTPLRPLSCRRLTQAVSRHHGGGGRPEGQQEGTRGRARRVRTGKPARGQPGDSLDTGTAAPSHTGLWAHSSRVQPDGLCRCPGFQVHLLPVVAGLGPPRPGPVPRVPLTSPLVGARGRLDPRQSPCLDECFF
uniref:Tetraspanin-32 n=1 Tax=Prolemur simus TaxID=1328070 RepID=A0A8C9B0W3_PROSS